MFSTFCAKLYHKFESDVNVVNVPITAFVQVSPDTSAITLSFSRAEPVRVTAETAATRTRKTIAVVRPYFSSRMNPLSGRGAAIRNSDGVSARVEMRTPAILPRNARDLPMSPPKTSEAAVGAVFSPKLAGDFE